MASPDAWLEVLPSFFSDVVVKLTDRPTNLRKSAAAALAAIREVRWMSDDRCVQDMCGKFGALEGPR